MTSRTWCLSALLFLACGARPEGSHPSTIAPAEEEQTPAEVELPEEETPTGRLSQTVQPLRYRLALSVDPSQERFSGEAEVDVRWSEPRGWIYLHGNELEVSEVALQIGERLIPATYEQLDDQGVAVVRLAEPVLEPGEGTLRFTYTAPFNRALRGLYRVDEGEHHYAFTQFEATSARLAFPCFDEPAFKVPFDMTMTVRADDVAVFNTPVANEATEGDTKTVRFETTKPMPTYLVAMAIGPLDVVQHDPVSVSELRDRPIPLRGIAARGKGEQLAYALEHTAEILVELEEYFGIAYPYAKLDIVAVPDFGAGAMENVGLITFRETLLLLGDGEDAPEWQRRAYAYVMAHELAHQWFGNLVTMPWWDDIWLNEAFATWMGYKAVEGVYPAYRADLQMLERVQGAMSTDSLVSARQIRQPIESNHDIRNAFDSITYRKGGGVLSMFEQWLTTETFRDGIRRYMREHEWGTATYEDLLTALGEVSDRDVSTPFSTFLFQPGLPFLQVGVECGDEGNRVTFAQSRYLPSGSTGSREQTWQIPVCVRTNAAEGSGVQCTLLTAENGAMDLDACPEWVMPNANASGYYRFGLESEWLEKLSDDGWESLNEQEKIAVADSLGAAFASGAISAEDLYGSLQPLARSEVRAVATRPMGWLRFAAEHLVEDGEKPRVRAFAKRLYTPAFRRLGWEAREGEDGEVSLLRAAVIGHLALFAKDARVRRDAVRRAHAFLGYGRRGDGEIHRDAVDPNLVGVVLRVAIQDGDQAFFDHVLERMVASDDALLRGELLGALASTTNAEQAETVRRLALDPRLRTNEITRPLWQMMSSSETRAATWAWVKNNFGPLAERLELGAGSLPGLTSSFCTAEEANDVREYFGTWVESLSGGPRNLANALERIQLCGAQVEAQSESASEFF